ncbi:MAG: tetraacyldisaccharide 4'-kinase [Acidobacteria bacterium]|nr:tetraacyldisaccharide 4'-kinase [Acidobacteriota bacterium]
MSLSFPLSTMGQAAANLYTAGSAARTWVYQHGWIGQQRLRAKVISIGNIAWGGTSKTPFTIWLADRLSGAGVRVSILTRGYGRTSRELLRVFSPGESPPAVNDTGDEAQLYLRHLCHVPIGIAHNRYEAGHAIEDRFPLDVHLLDDGFQHLALARDLDVVLMDARNPWGARWGISRVLREGPAALRRAHAILITNCGLVGNGGEAKLEFLKLSLRKLNPESPQFLASTRIVHFVERNGPNCVSLETMAGRRALAFCGLGNPDNFFSMLNDAGVPCVAREAFHDHHRYRVHDLERIAKLAQRTRVDCLITTEKDLLNLPHAAALSIPLYWASIQIVVEGEDQLLRWVGEKLGMTLGPAADATAGAEKQRDLGVVAVTGIRSHPME